MGSVYEVIHVETERRRALKVMLPDLATNPSLRSRFKREAKITANVGSEFIVEVFDAGIDAATSMPFLVMELLEGEELGKRIERAGALPAEEAMTLVRQVASALEKTHAAGIVHRDLKPENLFLTSRDDGSLRTKILDFGISKLLKDGSSAAVTKTVGTPLYMAPEQMAEEPISGATDLYSLSLIVYALLTGTTYWQEEADRASSLLAFAVLTKDGPQEDASVRAARHGAKLPPGFDAWFRRATARDPAVRFARASELAAGLAEVLGLPHSMPLSQRPSVPSVEPFTSTKVHSTSATGEPWITPLVSPRSRQRLLIAGGVLALIGIGWVAYGSLLHGNGRDNDRSATATTPPTADTVAANIPPPPLGEPTPVVTPLVTPMNAAALPPASVEGSARNKAPHAKSAPEPPKIPAGEAAPGPKLKYTRD